MTPRNTAAPNGNQPVEKIPQKCFQFAPIFMRHGKVFRKNFYNLLPPWFPLRIYMCKPMSACDKKHFKRQ